MTYLAIILSGGRGSRLGHRRKDLISIGGRTLAQAAVDATDGAAGRILVGPPTELISRPGAAPIQHVWEQPQYAGPAAGVAAGWAVLTAGQDLSGQSLGHASVSVTELPVLILGVDMPRLNDLVPALLKAWQNRSATTQLLMPKDAEGKEQRLAVAISAAALSEALQRRPFASLVDAPMKALFEDLDTAAIEHPVLAPELLADIDTPGDARSVRAVLPQDTEKSSQPRR